MDDNCSGCGQKDKCGQIYRTLGQNTGPSVGLVAVQAFLIPIAIFIAGLAAVERFAPAADGTKWLILVKVGAATTLVLLYVSVLHLVMKKKTTNPKICKSRQEADGDTE